MSTWLPNAPATAIAPGAGDLVYLAGDFTRVGPPTGSACRSTPGRASPSRRFRRSTRPCAPSSRTAPAAGSSPATFTQVGGTARAGLAHLAADGSLDTTWNPAPDGAVDKLVRSGSTVYARGSFTTIGGRRASGSRRWTRRPADGLEPGARRRGHRAPATGSTVYVAGAFGNIAGEARPGLAALDATTGAASAWTAVVDGDVTRLAATAGAVYLAGDFGDVGGTDRQRLAALHPVTGALLAWAPEPDGRCWPSRRRPPAVYAGGSFATIGGQEAPDSRRSIPSAARRSHGIRTPTALSARSP